MDVRTIPSPTQTFQALMAVGHDLGERYAYAHRGAYHFNLDGDGTWTLSLTPDSAGRLRLQACHLGEPRVSLWCLAGDRDRLASIVCEIREVHALAGA